MGEIKFEIDTNALKITMAEQVQALSKKINDEDLTCDEIDEAACKAVKILANLTKMELGNGDMRSAIMLHECALALGELAAKKWVKAKRKEKERKGKNNENDGTEID